MYYVVYTYIIYNAYTYSPLNGIQQRDFDLAAVTDEWWTLNEHKYQKASLL